MLSNIPQELRVLPQWVAANSKKEPLSPKTGKLASVTDSATWGTFDEAVGLGTHAVGFVLSSSDPYAIIDLDDKPHKPLSPEEKDRHTKILAAFDTYTERSMSGRGYHIVVKGAIPKGVHRDSVEIYSSERYMIFTGNMVKARPIADHQALLTQMYEQMAPQASALLIETDELISDEAIVDMAMSASNSGKFLSLCQGKMEEYSSQSEADLALLSILAFYTRSNEQVRRLFRYSALGKRDKAQKNDTYINFALEKIRAKEAPPIEWEPARIAQEIKPTQDPAPIPEPIFTDPKTLFPVGLVGEIAEYFLSTSVRPVPEIALAAAIGFVAGVTGRSYNISGTGLNQYLILLARTGAGKEGILTSIDKLLSAIRPNLPMADQFMGPAAFASGQALIKHLAEKPCFISILGEFGLTLQTISDHKAPGPLVMLRRALLDLYTKSGHQSILRSSVYSDSEKNTKVVSAPSLTILGESTPETFFDGLDEQHVAEGLIPRFLMIHYEGARPPRNKAAGQAPHPALTQKVIDLVTIAVSTQQNNTCHNVEASAEAQTILDQFDAYADKVINSSNHSVALQLWNRAHLKVLKLAALIAVGLDPHNPTITPLVANWAIGFVTRDIRLLASKFTTGDVGAGDGKQLADLKRIITDYLAGDPAHVASTYRILPELPRDALIPLAFLSRRTVAMASFRNARLGATASLKALLQSMVENGELIEVPADQIRSKYKFSGKVYRRGS